VRKHFDSWNELVRAAGLEPNDTSRIDDDELFQAMKDAFVTAGEICTQIRFDKLCRNRSRVGLDCGCVSR
jgi:hypothetical protein